MSLHLFLIICSCEVRYNFATTDLKQPKNLQSVSPKLSDDIALFESADAPHATFDLNKSRRRRLDVGYSKAKTKIFCSFRTANSLK